MPFVFNAIDVGSTGFVVQDLQINPEIAFLESGHDFVVCWDAMGVSLCLEWLDQNDVCLLMECKHYVLIATHCSDGEAAHLIHEEFGEWDHIDMHGVCRGCEFVEQLG